ncbi:hypothetical protein Hanom_Chr12g01152421 [Helianthus anomalus]
MSKFLGEILTRYGLHISQVNALGLPRSPISSLFVTYIGGFYSFNFRTAGVLLCSRDQPKSFHD